MGLEKADTIGAGSKRRKICMSAASSWRLLIWFLGGIVIGMSVTRSLADPTPTTIGTIATFADVQAAVGPYAVSVAQQADGTVWLGTEGEGVFRYNERAAVGHQLTQFSTRDGSLADDTVYALCVDKENRVWAGHGNHGVSVFDGKKWRNYDVLDGPIGERIYSITCSLKDGFRVDGHKRGNHSLQTGYRCVAEFYP